MTFDALADLVRGATFDDFILRPQYSVIARRDPSSIDLSGRFSTHITLKRPLVSANLDTRSLHINYELLVRVPYTRLATEARTMFEEDVSRCRRIDLATWRKQRSLWAKIQERWAYLFLVRLDPFVARWQLRGMR